MKKVNVSDRTRTCARRPAQSSISKRWMSRNLGHHQRESLQYANRKDFAQTSQVSEKTSPLRTTPIINVEQYVQHSYNNHDECRTPTEVQQYNFPLLLSGPHPPPQQTPSNFHLHTSIRTTPFPPPPAFHSFRHTIIIRTPIAKSSSKTSHLVRGNPGKTTKAVFPRSNTHTPKQMKKKEKSRPHKPPTSPISREEAIATSSSNQQSQTTAHREKQRTPRNREPIEHVKTINSETTKTKTKTKTKTPVMRKVWPITPEPETSIRKKRKARAINKHQHEHEQTTSKNPNTLTHDPKHRLMHVEGVLQGIQIIIADK
ncbi:hypothetical protein G7K_5870-t1 [Saitoella complicata NRRL Y-17804]|uniref:Uncharacterized protein n=1 Tax=Saitoella complicata (strain BCRC 22490 / CBS 7301 / JCM 7358 / NBRC 10748 / NRRL Y-17804) TaxID=698492 RepID=A0A0E9NPH1_SAICN|nr:hypothetical protein G7K_5870-t1 [Saitoella complicata NRRL Y-17804]